MVCAVYTGSSGTRMAVNGHLDQRQCGCIAWLYNTSFLAVDIGCACCVGPIGRGKCEPHADMVRVCLNFCCWGGRTLHAVQAYQAEGKAADGCRAHLA